MKDSSRSYLSPQRGHLGTNNPTGAAAASLRDCPQPPRPPCCRGYSPSGPHLHPGRSHQHPCLQTPGSKDQLSQEASSVCSLCPRLQSPTAPHLELQKNVLSLVGRGTGNRGKGPGIRIRGRRENSSFCIIITICMSIPLAHPRVDLPNLRAIAKAFDKHLEV